jgi:putative transposase
MSAMPGEWRRAGFTRPSWVGRGVGVNPDLRGFPGKHLLTLMRQLVVMPRYVRPQVTGATVFFTVVLADRGSDLLVAEVARLRQAVRAVRTERPFSVEAWVVLPDHLHAVWTLPAGDADYSGRWGAIKARFSMSLDAGPLRPSHIARREKGIWQRRFWEHHIRDEADFDAHVRYCWNNPVKHGLADRPEDWPYSSVHRDLRAGRYAPGG